MSFRCPFLPIAIAALFASLTAACGSADSSRVKVVTIGDANDPFETGVRLSLAGQLVRASVAEGLVAFDEQGRVIPALADSWIVTDDGKSYIFRLRGGTWRDGSEISARSAARAMQSAVKALRDTALGLDLKEIEEIRAMAGRVVEIRLSGPMPHLLQLLAQPELGLSHNDEGAGPMRLTREGDIAMLTPIPPEELGLPAITNWEDRKRTVGLSSVKGADAVRLFNSGEADLVLGGRVANFPETSSVGILRGTIQLDPVEGLFGLQVMTTKGFLGDPANREALALAVDRDALIAPFGVAGWTAATSVVPAAIKGDNAAQRWEGQTIEQRRAAATARVASWRGTDSEDQRGPAISVWLPKGRGSDMLFDRLRQDFGAIGVTLTRAEQDERGDLRLMDIVARYPRPSWYLNRFHCGTGKHACSPEADAALNAARQAADPAERAGHLAEAEQLLGDANVFIPFGSPIRWSLVRGNAIGFAANPWGWHPLMPMALLPK